MSKNFFYSVFGLNIKSELELPGLQNGNSNPQDLVITEGYVPDNLVYSVEYQGNFQYTDNEFLFKSKNSGKFWVKNSDEIIFEKYDNSTYEDVRVLLLSIVMGIVLHKKEKFPLHASAVEYNGKTLLFSGMCGSGKSTIAAAFIQHGAKFISDDITVIDVLDDKFFAVPSFSQMKLWPDSLEELGLKSSDFEKFRPKLEKRKMTMENMQAKKSEICVIYFLQRNNMNKHKIEELSVQSKIHLLENNTFRIRHLKQIGNNQKHFGTCCELAKSVQIKKLTRPQNQFLLDETIDMIIEDMRHS
jgi:hypothetical protein